MSVKNGADLLDRLVKDIVAEQPEENVVKPAMFNQPSPFNVQNDPSIQHPLADRTTFSLPRFIPLLSERIYTVNPFTRSFLISWISVLDSVPQLELISYLPDFLDGLLGFVSDRYVQD